jgi:hypothetical protein
VLSAVVPVVALVAVQCSRFRNLKVTCCFLNKFDNSDTVHFIKLELHFTCRDRMNLWNRIALILSLLIHFDS